MILIIGAAVIDYLGTVTQFPQPDDKVRAKKCETVMGGNALNASIALGRLGVHAKILTKLGNDYLGFQITDCLKKDGVDTQQIVLKENATSSFSYIILDQTAKTRTIINNPCEYLLDISEIKDWQNIFNGVEAFVSDGKHPQVASQVNNFVDCINKPKLISTKQYQ